MDNNSILELFFNEVLPSIAKGNLKIDDVQYNVCFNSAISINNQMKFIEDINREDLPTLVIKNIQSFSTILLKFIHEIQKEDIAWEKPYFDISDEQEKMKYYLSSMWANMTTSDFEDPENYINRYISFLRDNTFKNLDYTTSSIEALNNCYLNVTNIEEKNCFETPYAFRLKIVDNNNQSYALPDVKYAIENNNGEEKAYIYAIQYNYKMLAQNKKYQQFSNKVNRLLYKVNQDVPKDEEAKSNQTKTSSISKEENIIDVTPSSIISLTVALSLFANRGINKIIVPSSFPIRWHAQKLMYENKLNKLSPEEYEITKQQFEQDQEHIGSNITNKMVRNFMRLKFHLDGLDILAYPFDVDNCMHISLSPDIRAKNPDHLLSQILENVKSINNDKLSK